MAAFLDNVRFNPTTGGLTDWTISSAVANYQLPSAAGAVNTTLYKYFALDLVAGVWEIGEGAYNTVGPVLPRTTVLYNSSGTGTAVGQSGAGTKINFANVPTVAIIGIKEDVPSLTEANTFSGNNTISGTTTHSGVLNVTNTTVSTSISTGAEVVSGGLGVAKNLYVGQKIGLPQAMGNGAQIDISGATALGPIANGANASLGMTGYVEITIAEITTSGDIAKYLCSTGTAISKMVGVNSTVWVDGTTTPTAGHCSVAFSGATWNVYNNTGTSRSFRAMIKQLV